MGNLVDLAEKHGTRLRVWRVVERSRRDRRKDGSRRGGRGSRVVLAEFDTYDKTSRIAGKIVMRYG